MLRPQSNTSSIRPGFSMAELMIAIVILGLGMLMVATMFPVAWTRARDMSEFTTQTTVGNNGAFVMEMQTVVTLPDGSVTSPSFIGDVDPATDSARDPALPLVHQVHMWNQFATNPGGTGAYKVEYEASDDYGAGWTDISMDTLHVPAGITPPYHPYTAVNTMIGLEDRVLPPLPPRPVDTSLPPELRTHWDETVATRRFLWAAFNRFDVTPTRRADVRSLTMYYVTLRRPESTNRYARQDPAAGVGLATRQPVALASTEDVRFPVPWLIHLDVRGNWDSTIPGPQVALDPTGIPSEAIAGGDSESKLIAQMLQKDSMLIDRLTGAVYTVKSHRYTKTGSDYDYKAVVTLDREVQVADLDPLASGVVQVDMTADAADPTAPVDTTNGTIRPFWTFPPPIERFGDGDFVFSGKQPVVGVEIRPLVKRP